LDGDGKARFGGANQGSNTVSVFRNTQSAAEVLPQVPLAGQSRFCNRLGLTQFQVAWGFGWGWQARFGVVIKATNNRFGIAAITVSSGKYAQGPLLPE